jgi:hypothetical protein
MINISFRGCLVGQETTRFLTGPDIQLGENYIRANPEARASSLVFKSPEVIATSTPELKN